MSRLALVTGAARGIGRAVVDELLAREYRVIATARAAEQLAALEDEIDSPALEVGLLDIEAPDVPHRVEGLLGDRALSLLVLNAARFAPWDETVGSADLSQARAVVETNLFGSWAVVQAALPALRRARGTIIGVGSGAGSHGDPRFGLANGGAASYAVSKAALHALLHKLSSEVAGDGIQVHVADPGLTATSPGMEEFGARPVPDGARSILAPLDGHAAPGVLTRDGAPLPW
ncbi:SDR family NAD(P)-dependent oxidoreductase [Microbacterium sp. AZCO]|uniref:SDR family NAD(P)-dependent oxidoreductase n=1 Tax=Microbacterium sp. AZCO TaxID=3142976 RepID=UPI0031F40D11